MSLLESIKREVAALDAFDGAGAGARTFAIGFPMCVSVVILVALAAVTVPV